MRRNSLLTLAAALSVAIVIIYVSISPRPGTARYHVARLSYLRQPLYKDAPSELDGKGHPVHFGDYFRFQTWRWYWRGGFSITKLIDEREQHQQALIQLGYYERREFILTNRSIDGQLWAMITYNAVLGESVWWYFDDSRPKWVRVTARKEDMPLVERTVVVFDTSVAK